ncbi:hypothetical protein JOC34_002808 [Virgibacillus halotolerans]|uniref:tail fiber domain-containing protein n=1 Tax=Virgibacillus halotolerans TaxID=1071053 RepID=UPI001961EBC2|nr:tail fiber domain-containing protein [Virgibacillus halotolerans]MBM7600417.1 hypothetical protein [Virgibacillus halotolerans]
MERFIVDSLWDRVTRNDINNNFEYLFRGVDDIAGLITERVYSEIVDGAKLEWKEPVNSLDELPDESLEGEVRMVRDTGKVYRFNGKGWLEIQEINTGPVNEIDDRLNEKIDTNFKDVTSKLEDLTTNVKSHGAVGDGEVNDTDAVLSADSIGRVLYFPPGVYILDVSPSQKSYGDGATLIVEGYRMTLDDKALEVNSMWQDYIRLNNTDLGINAGKRLDDRNYGNVAVGNNALKDAQDRTVKNIAIGHNAMQRAYWSYQNVVLGTDAGRDSAMLERNTIIGSNAGLTMGDDNVTDTHSYFSEWRPTDDLDDVWPEWRSYAGTIEDPNFKAVNRADAKGNTALGRNAMGWTITPTYCTAVGYNALEKAFNGINTVAIGEGALYNGVKSEDSVVIGNRANENNADNQGDTSVGYNAMQKVVHSSFNVVMGYQALSGFDMTDTSKKLSDNVAIGRFSMGNTSGAVTSNVAVGASAMRYGQGNFNVAIGQQSLQDNSGGSNNVAVGYNSAKSLKSATSITALGYNALNNSSMDGLSNITGVGQNSSVTASNQIQLGNSSATPTAFNPLQVRSDRRDKLDIEDTQLGLNFINKLRPVQYRTNFREAYIDYDKDGNPVNLKNDGSRAGTRKHQGLIAQEVKQVIDDIGIDFAGYQDHKIGGGQDVHSLGYEELIAPLIKSIQELSEQVNFLEYKILNQ